MQPKTRKDKHWVYRSWEQNGSYSRLGGILKKEGLGVGEQGLLSYRHKL